LRIVGTGCHSHNHSVVAWVCDWTFFMNRSELSKAWPLCNICKEYNSLSLHLEYAFYNALLHFQDPGMRACAMSMWKRAAMCGGNIRQY